MTLTLERVVQLGVVDESFPADRGAWLFEVYTHDNMQVILRSLCVVAEFSGVFKSRLDIVH
jgi:hypothetical protein